MERIQTIGLELEAVTEALEQAIKCDKLKAQNPKKCVGELFGVVITVKELFDVKDLPTTFGCYSRINNVPQKDGQIIKVLKNAGAIIMAKSNVPQLLRSLDSSNYIFGNSKNPWDKSRIAGGSTGGEAALIASRCSPIGLGSDLGGSLRIPASFCGITTLKPSSTRISSKGHSKVNPSADGQRSILNSVGPLGKTVEDCAIMLRALLNKQNYENLTISELDHYQEIIPFREELYSDNSKKFRVGYFKSNSFVTASLSNQRAVEIAVDILKQKGHSVTEIDFPNFQEITLSFISALQGDGANVIGQGEQLIDSYQSMQQARNLGNCGKKIISSILKCVGEKRMGDTLLATQILDCAQDRSLTDSFYEFKDQFIQFWNDKNLDCIVCPSFGCPAIKFGLVDPLNLFSSYVFIWNALNCPAGIIPVTKVREDEQNYENSEIKDFIFKKQNENLQESSELPVGVQIVTLPLEEEKCLNIMKQIESEIKFRQTYPYPF